jgi:2-succinyl-6-hydroxy-2,4-cyclohexadiene-1-carboxylate synthase
MGGFIALQFAIEYPELITSLVLVGTSSSWIDLPGYAELRKKLDEIARRDGMEAAFEYDALHNPLLRRHFEKHPELREIAKSRICRTSVEGFTNAGQALLHWPGVTSRVGEISVPTLVMLGAEDTAFRQPSKDLAKAIPASNLKLVPKAGHSPHEERPTTFNKFLIEFLNKIDGG